MTYYSTLCVVLHLSSQVNYKSTQKTKAIVHLKKNENSVLQIKKIK